MVEVQIRFILVLNYQISNSIKAIKQSKFIKKNILYFYDNLADCCTSTSICDLTHLGNYLCRTLLEDNLFVVGNVIYKAVGKGRALFNHCSLVPLW